MLAYQMPLVLSTAGINVELLGHYNAKDYNTGIYSKYKGDFMRIDISPLMQFKFGNRDSLYVMTAFSSRRSFAEKHEKTVYEPYLTYTGREWYFYRIAFSWTHTF